MTIRVSTRLAISPHARISGDGGDLVVATPSADATLSLAAWPELRSVLPNLMGHVPVGDLARNLGAPVQILANFFAALTEAEILWDVTDLVVSSSSDRQLTAYFGLCDAWALDIFCSDFWSLIWSGQAPPALLLSWCEQFYHRTEGADRHNATALQHCTRDEIRDDLSQHFREEKGHGSLFLDGLEASGVAREGVLARGPNGATRSLVDYMDELGRNDSLAYLGCYGVLHSPRGGQTPEVAHAQFNELTALYPLAAPAIDAFRRHLDIDLRQKHDEIALERYVSTHGPLSEDEALRILAASHGMVRRFSAFFEELLAENTASSRNMAH